MLSGWITNSGNVVTFALEHTFGKRKAIAAAASFCAFGDGTVELVFMATAQSCKNGRLGMFLIAKALQYFEEKNFSTLIVQVKKY